MFDYIAMGIPMVVSTTRSIQETFPTGCFESFISDDPRDLAQAILRLHKNPELAMSYAKRAKDAAQPYTWPVQRRTLLGPRRRTARSAAADPQQVVGGTVNQTAAARPAHGEVVAEPNHWRGDDLHRRRIAKRRPSERSLESLRTRQLRRVGPVVLYDADCRVADSGEVVPSVAVCLRPVGWPPTRRRPRRSAALPPSHAPCRAGAA